METPHTLGSQRPNMHKSFRDRKGTEVYKMLWAKDKVMYQWSFKGSLKHDDKNKNLVNWRFSAL